MGAIKRMGVILMKMYHNYQVIKHLNNHFKIINILFTTYTFDLWNIKGFYAHPHHPNPYWSCAGHYVEFTISKSAMCL